MVDAKKYIDHLVQSKRLPYIDVCAWQAHQPIFRYGVATDGRVTGKEPLFLYSASKPMTVACGMRLIEEGKLFLDDPVSKYLPAYAHAYTEKGVLEKPMLVRHLFTMTAGLSYDVRSPATLALQKKNPLAGTLDFVNTFVENPLDFEPGERFQYSLCHDVLGAVIEVVSGKRFADYMREILFSPLGMDNTDFHLNDTREMTRQYIADADGRITEMARENSLVLGKNYDSGGAGVCGCVDDYIRFADALACGGVAKNGQRILQKSTIEQLRDARVGGISLQNSFTCVQGNEYGYGLGVRVRTKDTEWGLQKGEFGWDGAAGTYLMVDPAKEISVVIGMHVRSWPFVFADEHLEIVKRIYQTIE